jgi:hypothetical protein
MLVKKTSAQTHIPKFGDAHHDFMWFIFYRVRAETILAFAQIKRRLPKKRENPQRHWLTKDRAW